MALFPRTTLRLTLRGFTMSDLDDVHAYHALEDVARFHYWEARTREELANKFEEWIPKNHISSENQMLALAAVESESGRLVGDVFLGIKDEAARQGEIGYSFNPKYQGQGYATEAITELVEVGFESLNLHRIFARCDVRNVPSWKLCERLGMRREAHFKEHAIFKGSWDEEYYYAMLASEWRERHPPI